MAVSSQHDATEAEVFVDWILQPESVTQLVDASSSVLEAEVISISSGPPVANGAIGTQLVEMRTMQQLGGEEVPSSFTLSSIGDAESAPAENPPFQAGETHILFVKPMPQGPAEFVAVAPEGRLDEATSETFASPVEGTPISDVFDGNSTQEIESTVTSIETGGGSE